MWPSVSDARQQHYELTRNGGYDPLLHSEASFGEVFAASVGHVFDEGLSISSMLNREGEQARESQLKEMVADGFDIKPYQDDSGRVDYNRIAEDTGLLKTNRELFDDRRALLERRRNYSEDVKARGSGMAQFLGEGTAFLLDPINIATLPVGAAASSLRGLSTLARVGRLAATEAAIATATEAAIQPLVFQHKNEIGSPYEVEDAIQAIATTALFAGAVGGIAGLFRRTADLPIPEDSVEGATAIKNLVRTAEDLEANPSRVEAIDRLETQTREMVARGNDELQEFIEVNEAIEGPLPKEVIEEIEVAKAVLESRARKWAKQEDRLRAIAEEQERVALAQEVEGRLTRGERKKLKQELNELRYDRNQIEVEPVIKKRRNVSARKAKQDAINRAIAKENELRADIDGKIADIEARLRASEEVQKSVADMSRLEQGIYSPRLQRVLDKIANQRLVDIDSEYYRTLEAERAAIEVPSRLTTEDGEIQLRKLDEPTEDFNINTNYDDTMIQFRALDQDIAVTFDEKVISSQSLVDELQAVQDGLESVRVCAYG